MTTDPETTYHYRVIARALEEIDHAPGLSLEALAARMGMSAAHFQRVFSAWVGVSPKRWQQYLALDLARHLLAERHSLVTVAEGAGLSGTARLHDLFLRWESMTPGEAARGAEGLVIRRGWTDGPFGRALVLATDRGICGLGFAAESDAATVEADLIGRWPAARHLEDPAGIAPLLPALWGEPGEARLHLIGAPFQIKVWEALLSIPPGHVATYSDLAAAIGHPGANRAVGTAVGRNPISWLIPCHRALRKSGALGGYHWGLPVKRAMLAWEAARAET